MSNVWTGLGTLGVGLIAYLLKLTGGMMGCFVIYITMRYKLELVHKIITYLNM